MFDSRSFQFSPGLDPKAQADAIACAIAYEHPVTFMFDTNVRGLVEMAMFLQLALENSNYQDLETLKFIERYRCHMVTFIKKAFPCFKDFPFEDFEAYWELKQSVQEVPVDPQTFQMFNNMFNQVQQAVDGGDNDKN